MADNALVLLISALVLAGAVALIALALRWRRKCRKARGNPNPARDYAPRAKWGGGRGALNYSSFVFMDVDGDGKFGKADRPMGGIVVRAYDDKGAFLCAVRTNNGGFANFVLSASKHRAVLRAPGKYRFSVSVPKGWRVSTGNEDQSLRLDAVPGSPAGLAGEDLPKAVGLSPARFVRGTAAAEATLSLIARGKPLETAKLAPGGFHIDLPDKADMLAISGPGIDRRLVLSPYATDLGLLRPGAIAADAALETVAFSGVTALPFQKVPCGHGGLDWRNFNALTGQYVANSEGYVNGNLSRGHVAYTSSGHPAEFWRAEPFGFHSVMLTAAWLSSEGEVALVESWLGDELVASDEIVLSALAPVHYAPMLKAVTRVRVSTKHYWQAVLDELVLAR
ncbi:hypothetical protein EH240_25685 [Mesorhizobium tamadayense]|uniref:SD-repeat containing protein B domain-containing protein n=1 Tax=Mesorhizobium tamadayense TaxID=425306 RepID=A0A3P3F8M7_9HYPH|nr:hypothetical protein [Mesorhizobium tamadayense]RRH94935.1 hypothetical protein EH240_25685 [Mesorhizobium tamadayense]